MGRKTILCEYRYSISDVTCPRPSKSPLKVSFVSGKITIPACPRNKKAIVEELAISINDGVPMVGAPGYAGEAIKDSWHGSWLYLMTDLKQGTEADFAFVVVLEDTEEVELSLSYGYSGYGLGYEHGLDNNVKLIE